MVDVLVIGAGPAGSAAARRLAELGHHVVVVERRPFPRPKACGDALTPAATRALVELGVDLAGEHRLDGLLVGDGSRRRSVDWPTPATGTSTAVAIRRDRLDERLARHAAAAGAELLEGHEATEPIVERGFVRGAVVRTSVGNQLTIRARYLIVADGANSTFGRALGTSRNRGWPYGTAIRAYWHAEQHGAHRQELGLDLGVGSDATEAVPGFGWVVPLGDGTVNLGVAVIGSERSDVRAVNTARLLDSWALKVADRWGLDPHRPQGAPAAGRLPVGGSIEPKAGPTFLVVGDAAGTGSPLFGNGIDTALQSGMLAAEVVHEALTVDAPTALQRYPRELARRYGDVWKLGRLGVRALAHPAVARRVARIATGHGASADLLVRLALDERRVDGRGLPEAVFGLSASLARFAPDA